MCGKREIKNLSRVNSCNDSLFADMTLTLHKSQVYCFGIGNMLLWACSSLNPLLCLQRQVAKLGSKLFNYWPLLRNNNMATNLRRCTSSYGGRRLAACESVLPTLRFSRKFGLVFLWICGFFKTCGLLVFGLVLIEFCLFFGLFLQISVLRIAFFSNFMALLLFEFTAKSILGVFLWSLLILGLFFWIFHPDSLFDFLANFSFCWIFLPTHFRLVFRLNYLFLTYFSNSLACSWKITWHHWCECWMQTSWQVMQRDSACW